MASRLGEKFYEMGLRTYFLLGLGASLDITEQYSQIMLNPADNYDGGREGSWKETLLLNTKKQDTHPDPFSTCLR